MEVSPFAGKPAEPAMRVNVPKLVTAYYTDVPDPAMPEQRVVFGTSGHRGSPFAGASFVRRDGSVQTTDKDSIVPALLAAEMTTRMGRDPGAIYLELTRKPGEPVDTRIEAPATAQAMEILKRLSPQEARLTDLAGDTKSRPSSATRPATALPWAG